jgi:Hemerythrin HHE cation binding domain
MPEEFVTTFMEEHRQLRNVLLALIEAFESGDSDRASDAIEEMTEVAAPHFYFEQEALFPALAEVLGDQRIGELLVEHGQTVETARQLAELAEQNELDEETASYGAELARQLLPHADDFDDLAVVVGVLEPETVKKIRKAHKESKKKGATLAGLSKGAVKKAPGKKVIRKAAMKKRVASTRGKVAKSRARKAIAGAKHRRK